MTWLFYISQRYRKWIYPHSMPFKNALRLYRGAPLTLTKKCQFNDSTQKVYCFFWGKKKKNVLFRLTRKSPLCSTSKLSTSVFCHYCCYFGNNNCKAGSCFTHWLASAAFPCKPVHCIHPFVLHRHQASFLGGEFYIIWKARRFTFVVTAGRKSLTSTQSTLKRIFFSLIQVT